MSCFNKGGGVDHIHVRVQQGGKICFDILLGDGSISP
jgi:hypothetical protein